jgi:hypothetical protein
MQDKEQAKKECQAYEKLRNEFFELFDQKIPKDNNGLFVFDGATLDAQELYALFYKLDYQARKLRGLVVGAYNLKAD